MKSLSRLDRPVYTIVRFRHPITAIAKYGGPRNSRPKPRRPSELWDLWTGGRVNRNTPRRRSPAQLNRSGHPAKRTYLTWQGLPVCFSPSLMIWTTLSGDDQNDGTRSPTVRHRTGQPFSRTCAEAGHRKPAYHGCGRLASITHSSTPRALGGYRWERIHVMSHMPSRRFPAGISVRVFRNVEKDRLGIPSRRRSNVKCRSPRSPAACVSIECVIDSDCRNLDLQVRCPASAAKFLLNGLPAPWRTSANLYVRVRPPEAVCQSML